MRARLILFCLAAGMSGCAPSTPRVADTPRSLAKVTSGVGEAELVRTDSNHYRATVTADAVTLVVIATFTNRTQDTLVLHPCVQRPPYPLVVRLQREVGGVWRTALGPTCTLALMLNPPRLLPGQARTDTVRLKGWRRPNVMPQFPSGPIGGQYRLAYSDVYRKWYPDGPPPGAKNNLGEPLADSLLVSNPFQIEE